MISLSLSLSLPLSLSLSLQTTYLESSTTDEIFSTVTLPILRSVMQGFNGEMSTALNRSVRPTSESPAACVCVCVCVCVCAGTVFAYGQTSSGKTFTMMGTEAQPGVIPMAIYDYMEDVRLILFFQLSPLSLHLLTLLSSLSFLCLPWFPPFPVCNLTRPSPFFPYFLSFL